MFTAQILLFDSLIQSYCSYYLYEAPIVKSLQKANCTLDLSDLERDFSVWQMVLPKLANNSQIQYLWCRKLPQKEVSGAFIKLLTAALSHNTYLKSLSLRDNYIGNAEAPYIASLLKSNSTLKEIDLSYTAIDEIGINTIAIALQENRSLKKLDLEGCYIRGITNYLFHILSTHESIQELNFRDCSLQFYTGLTELLSESTSLKNLNLSKNDLGSYNLEYLTEGLQNNKKLMKLDLSSCGLDTSAPGRLQALAEALNGHPSLNYLNLSSNGLNAEAYPLATEIIKNNFSIRYLNLTANHMGDEAFHNLANAIPNNNSLTTLVLRKNRISNKGLKHLSEALQQNNTLVHLDLTENDFDSVQSLCDCLQHNIGITSIDFDKDKITDNSCVEIEQLLKRNQRIKNSYLIILKNAESQNDLHGMFRELRGIKQEFYNKDKKIWNPSQLEIIYNSSLDRIKFKLGEGLTINTNPEQNLLYFIDTYVKAIPLLNELKPRLLSTIVKYINTTSLEEDEIDLFNKLRGFLEKNGDEDESIDEESVESIKHVLDFLTQKMVSVYDTKEPGHSPPSPAAPLKKYYNQDDFIAKLREDNNYQALNKARLKFSGLCELICNYIIREDLMGLTSQSGSLGDFNEILPQNLNDIHLLAGLYQLNNDWVLSSHILDTSSHLEKIKAYLLNKYPYSLFSSSDVSKDGKQLDTTLFTKKLDALEVGCYIKFMVFTKSFGKMEGHSMLIKKNQDDTYSFFDPNKGEQLKLSSPDLCLKLNKSLKLYNATHMTFLDGLQYIKTLSQPTSDKCNASLSKTHLNVMKIDPLDRRANIEAVYDLLVDSIFRNEDNTSPRYINELKNILSKIDHNNEVNIVKNIIEIKRISKMEPEADENTHVHSLRSVFNSPTSTTFATIRSNLYQDPQIHKIMAKPYSHEQKSTHRGA